MATVVVAAAALLTAQGIGRAQSPLKIAEVTTAGKPTPIGGTFAKFADRPIVNGAGDVTFVADVAGGQARRAIFQASKGTVIKLVAEGDPTPIGGVFKSFRISRAALRQSGTVVFSAMVEGGRAPQGVFVAAKGKLTTVAAHGDPTPAGGTFGEMQFRPSVNDDDVIAFLAEIENAQHKAGIFLSSKGTLTKVVAAGDATPLGGTFDDLESPRMNGQGTIAFSADIAGGSVGEAVFLASGGKIIPVLRAGDPHPGGGRFGKLEDADIDERGNVPFRAFLEGAGSTTGFYLLSQGKTSKVVATGDPLPGGRKFESALGRPMANGRGAVAFKAQLEGGRQRGSREALYVAFQGTIRKVVAEGDPTPVGGAFTSITPPFLNDAGLVAFRASVQDGRASEGIFLAGGP